MTTVTVASETSEMRIIGAMTFCAVARELCRFIPVFFVTLAAGQIGVSASKWEFGFLRMIEKP
jgi:hypothetical protein